MLSRVGAVHTHATRSAGAGLFVSTRDHGSIGYRVPKEWASLTEGQRGWGRLQVLREGRGMGSWGLMGPLPVGIGGVMCVGGRLGWADSQRGCGDC